jgi:hypothetical protein
MSREGRPAASAIAGRVGIRAWTAPDTRLRRQRQCQSIWSLGPRVFFELIEELNRYHDLGEDLDERRERSAALDADMLRMVGALKFPNRPIRLAFGGGR